MKTAFFKAIILSIFFCFAFGTVSIKSSRGISSEPTIFEVIVHAPCEAYLNDALNSIQVSSVQANPTCLPISPLNNTQDVNDYHAHIFCTNIEDGRRSLFRFHEFFIVSEDETPVPGMQFIVSWVVNHKFREATNQYSYKRRPSCSIGTDICSDTLIVNDCYDNLVDIDGTFVEASDRVYFIPPGVSVGTCSINGACCPYISLLVNGLCGGKADCKTINCDDLNPCTNDTCSNGVCSHTPIVCTSPDFCELSPGTCDVTTGLCIFNSRNCNDGNSCTIDSCNSTTSKCDNIPIQCSSNNFCDTNARCLNGSCIFDTTVCNDNNACTSDFCNRTAGTNGACVFTPSVVCTPNVCQSGGTCNTTTGICKFGAPSCPKAPDACTFSRCSLAQGCFFAPTICTTDGLVCTVNSCNPSTGTCAPSPLCSKPPTSCVQYTCNEVCAGNPLTCPQDNGNQTISQYCTKTDRCTAFDPTLTCNENCNCCQNSAQIAAGTCDCDFTTDPTQCLPTSTFCTSKKESQTNSIPLNDPLSIQRK